MNDNLIDLCATDQKIHVNQKYEVNKYEMNPEDWMCRPSVWYGGTATGKTRHMKTILCKLREQFPRVVVFSPTNQISGDFNGIVSEALISDMFTPDNFLRVYEQANKNAEDYRRANAPEHLLEVFNIAASQQDRAEMNSLLAKKKAKLDEIQRIEKKPAIFEKKKQEFLAKFDDLLAKFIKSCVKNQRQALLADYSAARRNGKKIPISENGYLALKLLDFNPNVLFIFDDCMNEISELMRSAKKNEVAHVSFKNILAKGRHYFITPWFLFQDSVTLKPWMRDAMKNVIITDRKIAVRIFSTTKGEEGKLGMNASEKLFSGPDSDMKLFYRPQQKESNMFTYSTPEEVGLFLVVPPVVNNFCKSILLEKK